VANTWHNSSAHGSGSHTPSRLTPPW
jgi:hypothetical protein